jgi:hypothetical protein
MKQLTLTVLAVGFAAVALQPLAKAQFGSGIVFDPTQSGHAIMQIEHQEQSISNQFQQRHYGATSLQRRKAAIRTHASDDSRSSDALCAISVSNF